VNQAEQEKERMINEAEKRRNQLVPRARGEAQKVARRSRGLSGPAGEPRQRRGGSLHRDQRRVPQFAGVTRRRMYLEMIDEVLPKLGRVVVVEQGQMNPIPLLNLDSLPGRAPPDVSPPANRL
jgi:modulator of FtsH protease HflK